MTWYKATRNKKKGYWQWERHKNKLNRIEKYKGRTQNNQDNLERKIKLEDKIQQDDVSLAQG